MAVENPTGTIELINPIEIDGKTCKKLTFNTDELTIQQFAEAEAHSKGSAQKVIGIAEFDYTLHFYLGAYAIIAANPNIDITDLERVKGKDIMQIVEVGRFFTVKSEEQETSKSDAQPEITPASSQRQSQKSDE